MRGYAYGLPRIGGKREYKKTIESFWKGGLSEKSVNGVLSGIQEDNLRKYDRYAALSPEGEMSYYDPMLDTAILCGIYDPKNLKEYYELCRGPEALDMTKWFNTNYHYLAVDFGKVNVRSFRANPGNAALCFKRCGFPQFIGPFTFLKLSKGIPEADFGKLFISLAAVYRDILSGYDMAQIDEPAFAMDIETYEVKLINEGYKLLSSSGCRISLVTYYDSVDFMKELLALPVSSIGLDFVRGRKSFEYILNNGFPEDKTLIAGLVDGRNVWKNDIGGSIGKVRKLSGKANNIMVSNAAPLYHLPVSLSDENELPVTLKKCLAFAEEKLMEIRMISECYEGRRGVPAGHSLGNYGRRRDVGERIKSLKKEDFIKRPSFRARRKRHNKILRLPSFPTTTIGSFPQTAELRSRRAAFLSGELDPAGYKKYVRAEIAKLIRLQEELGLDVFVHGEFERSDMVEFFARKLSGIAATKSGWVISYGTRVYRPPVIFGDVGRKGPMTIDEIKYAQTKTTKPVKGMLTGPVTIIAWSYCREDIPISDVAYQISLALKDEIIDYERSGIKIVQVDEAAFREKAPVKRRDWKKYFYWAVKSFNLATNTDPNTQIHTHMCYSEFGEILGYINKMDFDVISIEASRSGGDIIASFENIDFKRQVGLGIWDIHSPAVPPVDKMKSIVKRSLKKIPKDNFWLNPDCGLKTRGWPETKEALKNLVETSVELRACI
ncbi:MAG: 5-methyltetrahydropteroyltriglutamate--homocysteine S-methyltransferase [Candidatus Omnitrophota bacterium]